MAVSEMKLKLLIDRNGRKVLFAEAEKDFIDFLFYILSLPISTVIRILKEKGDDVGSVKHLYDSLQNLANRYLRPGVNKTALLNHKSPLCLPETLLLLASEDDDRDEDEDEDEDADEDEDEDEDEEDDECKSTNTTRSVYLCRNCYARASEVPNSKCPNRNCGGKFKMNGVVRIVNSYSKTGKKEGGFVKGAATYMVMDNLEVKPLSTISSISILNKMNIQNVASLEEKDVVFGVDEALKLLKASMVTKNVLSSVFFGDAKA